MVKEVLVLFKTHLDIGYSDYAKTIVDKYINEFIPKAIKLGYKLRGTDTPFVWTVGSWLINEALKYDTDTSVAKAIEDGIIAWHGVPFTTHTELMSKELFEYGLSISEKLDKRFGKKTTGAKMTDVPGHTIAMVKPMAKAGVKFLHIGTNPVPPLPNVPSIFRWQDGEDSIIVMYEGGYGGETVIGDFAVVFGHTADNGGPQLEENVKELYAEIRSKYPDAKVRAATLSDVAEKLWVLEDLPVVDKEIGDTWIHGAGTDPKKLAMFRDLQRKFSKNSGVDISDSLLMVPEHTWGMTVQGYFHDTDNWENRDFLPLENGEKAAVIKKSWQEQRDYVTLAEKVMGIKADYTPKKPDLFGFTETCDKNPPVEISFELFTAEDYRRYEKEYMNCFVEWCYWDYTKKGLPEYDGGIFTAVTEKAYTDGKTKIYLLRFPEEITKRCGLPEVYVVQNENRIEVSWFGKKPCRLPQSFWCKFHGFDENWQIEKMGKWINPEEIISSNLICGFDSGIRNGEYEIHSLDAGLCAPFGRNLLRYGVKTQGQDMYFNLYNNIWNTNFPMWYEDDSLFRFEIVDKR